MRERFEQEEKFMSPPWENITWPVMEALRLDLLTEKLQGLNLDIQVRWVGGTRHSHNTLSCYLGDTRAVFREMGREHCWSRGGLGLWQKREREGTD